MADHIEVMIAAVAVAICVMYFASGPVAAFIERHPTTKMLALSFLLLIGAALVADALPLPHPARLYLLRHGVLGRRRGGQRALPCATRRKPKARKRAKGN